MFGYNSRCCRIRLTPLGIIWKPDTAYVINLNNKDRTIMNAPAGGDVVDGQTFQIQDAAGSNVTYEFESGYSMQVPVTLSMTLTGASGADISDTERFTVSDGTNTVTFEFDRNNNHAPANTPIRYKLTDPADQIAEYIVDALKLAGLGLNPKTLGGGQIHLGSAANHTLDTSAAPSIRSAGLAGGIADQGTFTLTDGTRTVTFEFEDDGIANGTDPMNTAIHFTTGDTHEEIADTIVTAIQNAGLVPPLLPRHLGNGLIPLGGAVNHLLDTSLTNL